METRDLDRLVSKTMLTPVSKRALRRVRKAALSGRVEGPFMTNYAWSVLVNDKRLTFSLRKDTDGS